MVKLSWFLVGGVDEAVCFGMAVSEFAGGKNLFVVVDSFAAVTENVVFHALHYVSIDFEGCIFGVDFFGEGLTFVNIHFHFFNSSEFEKAERNVIISFTQHRFILKADFFSKVFVSYFYPTLESFGVSARTGIAVV